MFFAAVIRTICRHHFKNPLYSLQDKPSAGLGGGFIACFQSEMCNRQAEIENWLFEIENWGLGIENFFVIFFGWYGFVL
jgi:hypothetical protein